MGGASVVLGVVGVVCRRLTARLRRTWPASIWRLEPWRWRLGAELRRWLFGGAVRSRSRPAYRAAGAFARSGPPVPGGCPPLSGRLLPVFGFCLDGFCRARAEGAGAPRFRGGLEAFLGLVFVVLGVRFAFWVHRRAVVGLT